MRRKALDMGQELSKENMRLPELSDLPAYTFYTRDGRTHCPFADAWKEKGDLGQELGLLYCNVNDSYKIRAFNPEFKLFKYIKNRNLGDEACDFVNVEFIEE
jgi:hypothetical protein